MGWLLLLPLVLVCSASVPLDTFTNQRIKIGKKTYTCSFTFIQNNNIVEVESSNCKSCNSKCSGKVYGISLGGPESIANLYTIDIQVTKGKIKINNLSSNLLEATTSSTSTTKTSSVTSTGTPIPNHTTLTTKKPKHVYSTGDNWNRGGNWNTCNRCVAECKDASRYPNIGQGFRGYNLILGDPLSYGGDPGYRAHIFYELNERRGGVRFSNTAGNSLNRCDGSVRADYIETGEEFLKSMYATDYSERRFQLGSEIKITGGISGEVGASLNGNVGGNIGGNIGGGVPPGPNGGINGGINGETGGGINVGGSAYLGVEVTIPPLFQSVSSNSKNMLDISEGLESNKVSITRASFSCEEYEFEITQYQHPVFTDHFKYAAKELESCLKMDPLLNDISVNGTVNTTTIRQNECAMKFFNSYGTYFIKKAKFGSKMVITTVLDSKRAYQADKDEVTKCSRKDTQWSFLGLIGGGTTKENCLDNLYATVNKSANIIKDEIVNTIGSRPKGDYSEWAEQQGLPEIIHKSVAPISDLFTTDFMDDMSLEFKKNGDAKIKDLLHTYVVNYCALFPNQCDYVVALPFCPSAHCNSSTFDKCGHYTGKVDVNFLPHGKGVISFDDGVSNMIWHHGCTEDCVVYPNGLPPTGYTLASEEQVISHKQWIIDSLDKWATAKFENGLIYGFGYGGQVITTEVEEETSEHMVVCKYEITTPAPTGPPVEKTYTYIEEYLPWVEAAQYCAELGKRLATLSTGTELMTLQNIVQGRFKEVWLAGNDMNMEGLWMWANGKVSADWVSFINGAGEMELESNWETGKTPNHKDRDCLTMKANGDFRDEDCATKRYFVCENSPDSIPIDISVKNYTYVHMRKTWLKAAEYCEVIHQKLATIKSGQELLRAQKATKEGREDCWIAGNDKNTDGEWNWALGSVSGNFDSFTNGGGSMKFEYNWITGIPKNIHENCALMLVNGEFMDYGCEIKKYFLCDDGSE